MYVFAHVLAGCALVMSVLFYVGFLDSIYLN